MEELESVLWELESAGGRANEVEVSLEFWKEMQCSSHIRLTQTGDIFYKYLIVNVNPQQETNFLLY